MPLKIFTLTFALRILLSSADLPNSNEYLEYFETVNPVTTEATSEIVIEEFRWMARIKVTDLAAWRQWYCSAILVDKQWLLTSSSCTGTSSNIWMIAFFKKNLFTASDDNKGGLSKDISAFEWHPMHDFVLLKLDTPIEGVETIELPEKKKCHPSNLDNKYLDSCHSPLLIAAGWSRQRDPSEDVRLQSLHQYVHPNQLCEEEMHTIGIESHQACLEGIDESQKTCNLEGGSIVVCPNPDPGRKGFYYLLGLISDSKTSQCGSPTPSRVTLFNRICPVLRWMKKIIGINVTEKSEPHHTIVDYDETEQPGISVNCVDEPVIKDGIILKSKKGHFIQCNEDFILTNASSNVVTCENGSWEYPGYCSRQCTIPARDGVLSLVGLPAQFPSDGDLDISKFTGQKVLPGSQLTIVCLYNATVLEGSPIATCQSDGVWRPSLGICAKPTRQKCDIYPIWHGFYIDKSKNEVVSSIYPASPGTTVQLLCNKGYRATIPQFESLCQIDGSWNPPLNAYCNENIPCKNLPFIENGVFINHHEDRGRRNIRCDDGYIIEGPSNIVCMVNGSWSKPGICKIKVSGEICQGSPQIQDGFFKDNINPRNWYVGEKHVFECNPGYYLVGSGWIECLRNATWHFNGGCVNTTHCSHPEEIENGYFLSSEAKTHYRVGERLLVYCDNGYTLNSSDLFITCLEKGRWSTFGPCSKVNGTAECEKLPEVVNGTIVAGSNAVGAIRYIHCNEGFQLPDKSMIMSVQCLRTGRWTKQLVKCFENGTDEDCSPHDCGPLPLIRFGNVQHSKIICNAGYFLVGNATVICHQTGRWIINGQCLKLINANCTGFPIVVDGILNKTHVLTNSKGEVSFQFGCKYGYSLTGESRVECQRNGTWLQRGRCVKINGCGHPDVVPNGFFSRGTIRKKHYNTGDHIRVRCHRNFKMNSPNPTIVCLQDGTWSKSGVCNPISPIPHCKPLHRVVNGKVRGRGSFEGANLTVICKPTYEFEDGSSVKRIHCLSNGNWSYQLTNCSLKIGAVLVKAAISGDAKTIAETLAAVDFDRRRQAANYRHPAQHFCNCGVCISNGTAMHYAMTCNRPDSGLIAWFLFQANADFNAREGYDLKTPLMVAAAKGNVLTVRFLIDNGADVRLRSSSDLNALDLAAYFGHTAVVNYLGSRSMDIDARNSRGETALMLAARRGKTDVVKLLIRLGADQKGCQSEFCT